MNISLVLFIVVALLLIMLLFRVLVPKRPQTALIRTLTEAGVRPGETEQLMASGVFWARPTQRMTDREVNFLQRWTCSDGISARRSGWRISSG